MTATQTFTITVTPTITLTPTQTATPYPAKVLYSEDEITVLDFVKGIHRYHGKIYNLAGELIRHTGRKNSEFVEIRWNKRSASGAMTAQGAYVVVVEFEYHDGSKGRRFYKIIHTE